MPGGATIDSITQTSSANGMTALSNNQCDIAMISRGLTTAEDVWAEGYAVARDPVLMIATDNVPSAVTSLSTAQIKYIYERGSAIATTTWNDVDMVDGINDWSGDSITVTPRAMETTSGTRNELCTLCNINPNTEITTITCTGLARFASDAAFQDGMNSEYRAAVGYVSFGYGPDDAHPNIRIINIVNDATGVAYHPSLWNVYCGYYPLTRFLRLAIHDTDPGTVPNPAAENLSYKLASIGWWQQTDGEGQDAVAACFSLRLIPDQDIIIDAENIIDASDLTELGIFWYQNVDRSVTRADITRDNLVDGDDLTELGMWWGFNITPVPGPELPVIVDNTPPASIQDLSIIIDTDNSSNDCLGSPSDSSMTLTWTAPGDDGSTGTAVEYDIRYSLSSINSGNWSAATQVSGEWIPQAAGSSEHFAVTGLNSNTFYCFALKTRDENSNWSAISNCPYYATLSEYHEDFGHKWQGNVLADTMLFSIDDDDIWQTGLDSYYVDSLFQPIENVSLYSWLAWCSAGDRWNNASGSPSSYTYSASYEQNIDCRPMYWANTTATGMTIFVPSTPGDPVTSADVRINEYYTDAYSAEKRIGTALHEFGHILDLYHNVGHRGPNLMLPKDSIRWEYYQISSPTPRDVEEVNYCYP